MFRCLIALSLILFSVSKANADLLTVNIFENGSDVVMQWSGSFDSNNLGAPTNTHTLAHQYIEDGPHRAIYAFGGGSVDSWVDPVLTDAFIPDFMITDGFRHADQISGFRWGILDHNTAPANDGELYIENGYVSGTDVSGEMTWLNSSFATLGFVDATGVFTYGDDDSIQINVSASGPAVPEPSSAALLLMVGSVCLFSSSRARK